MLRDGQDCPSDTGPCRPETIAGTLRLLRRKYDGAEGYFRSHLNLNGEDIAKIRRNYLVDGKSRLAFRSSPVFFASV